MKQDERRINPNLSPTPGPAGRKSRVVSTDIFEERLRLEGNDEQSEASHPSLAKSCVLLGTRRSGKRAELDR